MVVTFYSKIIFYEWQLTTILSKEITVKTQKLEKWRGFHSVYYFFSGVSFLKLLYIYQWHVQWFSMSTNTWTRIFNIRTPDNVYVGQGFRYKEIAYMLLLHHKYSFWKEVLQNNLRRQKQINTLWMMLLTLWLVSCSLVADLLDTERVINWPCTACLYEHPTPNVLSKDLRKAHRLRERLYCAHLAWFRE